MQGLKVLVLGGKGFLGSHLVSGLVEAGASVRVFARTESTDNAGPSGVDVHVGDFNDGRGLGDALDGIDVVYHLISSTVPSTSNLDPIGDVSINLCGTLRLLQLMRERGINRIVYVSSGGTIYGNPDVLPVPETHSLRPLCSYGVVKVAVENYLHMYSELHGLVANVLRVSNPYGMQQHHLGLQGVIPTFVARLRAGQPIEIWGDGSVVRDYIYVDDVVSALLAAGRRNRSGTFNIGSGVGYTLSEILDVLCEQTGLSADVRYLPNRNFDVQRIYLDITQANTQLGWAPMYTLRQGCEQYCRLLNMGVASHNERAEL